MATNDRIVKLISKPAVKTKFTSKTFDARTNDKNCKVQLNTSTYSETWIRRREKESTDNRDSKVVKIDKGDTSNLDNTTKCMSTPNSKNPKPDTKVSKIDNSKIKYHIKY